jgi:predicted small lipoprotein YifL
MRKGLRLLTAICLIMLCVTSCGRRPPLPPDDYGDITTTTAATSAAETASVTALNPAETIAPPSTSGAGSEVPAIPADGKYYTYAPPSYDGFTLTESVQYLDSGRIYASSHRDSSGYPAGFVIDYTPGVNLVISYTTAESPALYSGRHPMLNIALTDDLYGRVFIGETFDGGWDGEGYVFGSFSGPDFGWYTYADGIRNGSGYRLLGAEMFIDEYDNGAETSSTLITPIKLAENVYSFPLSGDVDFYVAEKGNTFRRNTVLDYFGNVFLDNASYRGQIVDGSLSGLGIYRWYDGDILIGQFENNNSIYGLYYDADDGACIFVKNVNGETTVIEEIEGMDIDFNRLLGIS